MRVIRLSIVAIAAVVTVAPSAQQPAQAPRAASNPRLEQYKRDVSLEVDGLGEMIQRMNDQVFSFAELGFQEFETSKYLTGVLRQNGFTVQTSRRRGWRAGGLASRSSRWAPISTTSPRPRKSRVSPITIRSSTVLLAMAKGTTPACRCRLPPRWR